MESGDKVELKWMMDACLDEYFKPLEYKDAELRAVEAVKYFKKVLKI